MFVCTSRRLLAVAFVFALAMAAIAADAPPPILENDHVRVMRIEVPAGTILPADNKYDVLTVQLEDGEAAVVESGQLEKTEPGRSGQVHYFVAGSKRSVKNLSKRTVPFIEVQFLRSQGKYVAFEIPASHYCNPGTKKACVTEKYLFCTDRFCAESVTLNPGAMSTQHTHDADHMVIPTSNFRWREEVIGKAPADHEMKTGDAVYAEPGITHRLTNVGNTTAQLVMVQFK